MKKIDRLVLANNFALGAHFMALNDLVTARMHAELAFKLLTNALGRNDGPAKETDPAKVECDAPQYHDGNAHMWSRFCPRCGVRLPEA